MFRKLLKIAPHIAAIAAGGVTFKVLNDADVDEKTLIIGTAAAAGFTDTAVAAGINFLTTPIAPLEFDDYEDEEYEEVPAEEDESEWLQDLGSIGLFTREVYADGLVIYIIGDTCIRCTESVNDAGVLDLAVQETLQLRGNAWADVPSSPAEKYRVCLINYLNRVGYKEMMKHTLGPTDDQEDLEDTEQAEERTASDEWTLDPDTITFENFIRQPKEDGNTAYYFGEFYVLAQEIFEPSNKEFIISPIRVNRVVDGKYCEVPLADYGVILSKLEAKVNQQYNEFFPNEKEVTDEVPVAEDSSEGSPEEEPAEAESVEEKDVSEEFAEAFVEAAEKGDEEVRELMDALQGKHAIEGSVLNFAQTHAEEPPSSEAKAQRCRRRDTKKKKDTGDGQTRTEQRFQ